MSEVNNPIQNGDIRLTEFGLKSNNVYPYYKPVYDRNNIQIYQGAIGINQYRYYNIPAGTQIGKKALKFIKQMEDFPYSFDEDSRFSAINSQAHLFLELDQDNRIERATNLEAYYMYWATLTDEEKLRNDYRTIPHFVALTDWYELALKKHIEQHHTLILDDGIQDIEVDRWKKELIKNIEEFFVIAPALINSAHARELLKFRNELIDNNKSDKVSSETQSNQPSQKAIALKYRLLMETDEGEGLYEHNKDQIATKYGWKSKYSGKKILGLCNSWAVKSNRLRLTDSPKGNGDKIEIFEEALNLLNETASDNPLSIQRLQKELETILSKSISNRF